jgi:hypothetical protein
LTGKAAAGVATGVPDGLGAGVDIGEADELVEGFPAVEHATSAIESTATKRDGTPKRRERAGIEVSGAVGRAGGVAKTRNPSLRWVEGGVR